MGNLIKANYIEKLAISGDYELIYELANSGSARAMMIISQLIENELIEPDLFENFDHPKSAYGWLRRASDLGHSDSMVHLAATYDIDPKEKYWLLHTASENGNPYAMMKLATMYEAGEYVEPDMKTCVDYYLEASALGLPNASVRVGDFYLTGSGVTKNLDLAEQFYRSARDQMLSPNHFLQLSEFDKFLIPDEDIDDMGQLLDEQKLREISDRLLAIWLLRNSKDKKITIEDATSLEAPFGRSTLSILGLL